MSLSLRWANGEPVDSNASLRLRPEGLRLFVDVPANQVLTGASLVLRAAEGEEDLVEGTPGATVSTDGLPEVAVNWIVVDWGTRRAVSSVKTTIGTTKKIARMKVSDGVGWFTPFPTDIISLGTEQRVPPVPASRVMLEVVKGNVSEPYNLTPSKEVISSIAVQAGRQPHDISVAVGDTRPFFEMAGAMVAGQDVEVTGLAEDMSEYLFTSEGATTVPLMLRSSVGGEVEISFTASTANSINTFDEDDSVARLVLPWDAPAIQQINIGLGSQLQSAEFKLTPSLVAERVRLRPESIDTAIAQFCDQEHSAAQRFTPLGIGVPLAGVDLYLRPLTPMVVGNLRLYPDRNDLPDAEPIANLYVAVELVETGEPGWHSRWVAFQLPAPVLLPDALWWAVLSISEGQALWYLEPARWSAETGLVYRWGGGGWLPRRSPEDEESLRALTRLRVADANPPPRPDVIVRRGESTISPLMDDSGFVTVGPDGLKVLNSSEEDLLEIIVTSQVAGEAVLSDLRMQTV